MPEAQVVWILIDKFLHCKFWETPCRVQIDAKEMWKSQTWWFLYSMLQNPDVCVSQQQQWSLILCLLLDRVQSLKFRAEQQSDLNDILLRVSAFGLFVYAVFSVIAGSLAFTHEPNLLVMITGLLSIVQVRVQLLLSQKTSMTQDI
jgi:hypothetical protein